MALEERTKPGSFEFADPIRRSDPMCFHASIIELSTAVEGEYLKILFAESGSEDCPYAQMSKSREFPRTPYRFECWILDCFGYGNIVRCELIRDSLDIDLKISAQRIQVQFNERDPL